MLALLRAFVGAFFSAFKSKDALIAENLVLRQQLAQLMLANPRPKLTALDRAFWVVLSRVWSRWEDALVIVKPATVIAWHREGFALFWRWKSRPVGRPPLSAELVALIRRMAKDNPLWSRRRISAELAKLGHAVDKDTVAKYMPPPSARPRRPRLQTWKTFLHNHVAATISIDFLTVPTVMFRTLYVFFVLSLDRRRILHVNVTAHPSALSAAQQIVEALGADLAPRLLIRDKDGSFGKEFDARVENLGIEQLRTAPHSPWQHRNGRSPASWTESVEDYGVPTAGWHEVHGHAERWVGAVRRELLDHVVVLGERHLLRMVREYAAYYNDDRPHMAIGRDAPVPRAIETSQDGRVAALPRVGGLHHRYSRAA